MVGAPRHPLARVLPEAEVLAARLRQLAPSARLVSDSRQLKPGDILVLRHGRHHGLEQLLASAVQEQAVAVVLDHLHLEAATAWRAEQAPGWSGDLFGLSDLSLTQGVLASAFYQEPSRRLRVTAVTGTNGKSTVVHGLARAWARLGRRSASIGTLGVVVYEDQGADEASEPKTRLLKGPGLTSLDAVDLQATLAALVGEGVTEVALEASSIGLELGRFAGCAIELAGLTNLSHEHLDHHGSLAAYAESKALLFEAPDLQAAVLAAPLPEVRTNELQAARGRILAAVERMIPPKARWLVSVDDCREPAGGPDRQASPELHLRLVAVRAAGLLLSLEEAGSQEALSVATWGQHNLQNLAVMAGLLRAAGLSLREVSKGLEGFAPPTGRLEPVRPAGPVVDASHERPMVLVDYAHTPDGLEQALLALVPLAKARGGLLRVVFGCGGDRDRSKRPKMGAIAARLADRVVLTSDNPRSEPPEAILQEILAGIGESDRTRVLREPDRAQAIDRCLDASGSSDVILVAGKGHETTQIQAGAVRPFDDRLVVSEALRDWRPGFSLQDLVAIFSAPGEGPIGRAWLSGPDRPIESFSIDSRAIRAGAVFVALVGDRFDGHDFLEQALASGASGLIVSAPPPAHLVDRIPMIRVADTARALGRLAFAWRNNWSGRLVGVAGSNGKTTVKEMLRAVFASAVGPRAIWSTPGNFNNQIGLPLSLLGLRNRHRLAVLEVGMNHPGEMAELSEWTSPDYAVITNAQREHQEFMGSVAACAEENGTLLTHLRPGGWAILPRDADHESIWLRQSEGHPVARFGLAQTPADDRHQPALSLDVVALTQTESGSEVRFRSNRAGLGGDALPWPEDSPALQLNALGRHLAVCAAAAAVTGLAMGLSAETIRQGLSHFAPLAGRGRLHRLGDRQTLVDDSYNANPDSVRAAILALADQPGRRGLVLGDMGEVGHQGPAFHDEVLTLAAEQSIDRIWLIGEAMAASSTRLGQGETHSTLEALAQSVQEWLRDGSGGPQILWLKGSRFMGLERLIPLMTATESDHAPHPV